MSKALTVGKKAKKGLMCQMLLYIHFLMMVSTRVFTRAFSNNTHAHYTSTPVLHSWDGILRHATFLFFLQTVTMVLMSKHFNFSFYHTRGYVLKNKHLSPHLPLQIIIVYFLSLVLVQGSFHCLTSFCHPLYKVFCFGVVPHIHVWNRESAFSQNGMMAGQSYDVYAGTFLYAKMNVLPLCRLHP